MNAKYAPDKLDELRAISENRKLVLDIAAELAELIRDHTERLTNDRFERRLTMLLVGAAFSLWRAVPLVHKNAEACNIVDASGNYLDRIIRHNSITYGDDDRERIWAFGFYMGNARYRFQDMCNGESQELWPEGRMALQNCGLLEAVTLPRAVGYDPAETLKNYVNALFTLASEYRSRFAS